MRKTLLIVASKPDAGLSNEILRMIQEEEIKKGHDPETGTLRLVIMNEEQWLLHRHARFPDAHVLFIGPVEFVDWLPKRMDVKFQKYGIRYGWSGRRASLQVNEKSLKSREAYRRFLSELKSVCAMEDIIESPRRPDILQLMGMLCVALLVPFGSLLVGGKLIKDWYANDRLIKKQQYVYGIFHLYRTHLKEFLNEEDAGPEK